MNIYLELKPSRRSDFAEAPGSWSAFLDGVEIVACSPEPERAAARWLLENGRAEPSDRLVAIRPDIGGGGGEVGLLAKQGKD